MRIITLFVASCCLLTVAQAASKKEKRQLDYSLGSYHRSDGRIHHNGIQHPPQYPPPQYYPGPPRPYRKGRPQYLPAPPYAVQMEPLIHYSQRDPLFDTNSLSPDTDPVQDQTDSVDRGGNGDTIYIPHKPFIKVVEKPVYIKEPEPIIEIIIKESNISLPPPPTQPPQKKKKEEVQVFYVKYKKNPHGHGKDAVIYDKPIPAISPPVPDDQEGEEEWNEAYNQVTEPPKPSTTLRTIIKPDSEVYHSPGNNVKVTFGKESFDYSKRSSKPEDAPRARQLSSFSDVYFKRPSNSYVASSSNEYRSEVRAPQPYRPFTNYPQPSNTRSNSRPPFFPPTRFPGFSHSISHPPPPHFHPQYSEVPPPNQRKPVPYTPFENIRPSPQPNHRFNPPQQQPFIEPNHHHQYQQQFKIQQPKQNQNQEHFAQRIIPPGGELLPSLPKFEQHLVVDPATGQLTQAPTQPRFRSEGTEQEQAGKQGKSQVQQRPQIDNSQFGARVQHTTRSYTTTTPKPTTTSTTPQPSTTTKDPKVLEAQLPDEVPDDLRQQLLSSGILNNADISILDYDKVGDIPLSALPPDQLANFYGAGGAQQIAEAGSELHPQTAALTASRTDQELSGEESEVREVTVKPGNVEMKVVKYNPDTTEGQKIQQGYVSEDAQKVDPVVLNDNTYNRYLPLKVNGTQFPIPAELKGKHISSVVILAPISYDFTPPRQTRETSPEDDLQLIQNAPLKTLLANPTLDNYKQFLENEGKTSVAKQAVVLLVTEPDNQVKEKEIYMYDIASKSVSKLNGELSSAFVEAAEANSSDPKTS